MDQALDATKAVDTLFEGGEFEDFVDADLAGLLDFAFDGKRPRIGPEGARVSGRLGLIHSKFVVVVVVRNVVVGVLFLRGAERALRYPT